MLPGEQARAKVLEHESALKHFKDAHHMVSMVQLIDESAILDSTEYFESVNRMGTALIQFDVRLKSVEFKLQEKLDLAISLQPEDTISNVGSISPTRKSKSKSITSFSLSQSKRPQVQD